MAKKRKIPLRKCIVTNEMKPKQELIRIVRNKEGKVFVDPTGKQNGRGAYIAKDAYVINQAISNKIFDKHFNVSVDDAVYEQLNQFIEGKDDA